MGSIATKKFMAEHSNSYPKMEGMNELFIDADNPHAEEILAYMESMGAAIGWNVHEYAPIEGYDGHTVYCAEKPVWVFKAPMSAKEFHKLLKSRNWLKSQVEKS